MGPGQAGPEPDKAVGRPAGKAGSAEVQAEQDVNIPAADSLPEVRIHNLVTAHNIVVGGTDHVTLMQGEPIEIGRAHV